MLSVFLLLTTTIFKINYSETQLSAGVIIISSILFYNAVLHRLRKYVLFGVDRFNPLYISLLQMILDLIALLMLVYFTGGIESPLYMQFVFLIIIGSLILPGTFVYIMAAVFILSFTILTAFEHYQIISHHSIAGLLSSPLYNNPYYVGAFLFTFAFMIFVSVYLANGIARQLYKQENALVDSIKKINAAEKEKQKYISGIVHEIKTPLAAVHSYLDLVLQKFLGPLDEIVEEKLIRARRRSVEAIELINNVLKISKLKIDDSFVKEEVEIASILARAIKNARVNAEAIGVKLSLINNRKEKRKIEGDPLLIQIALSNIISNAIKYNNMDGVVEITVDEEKDNLIIRVCDNGVGIPKAEIDKIFMDFFRASNIKHSGLEGSGLGLSVVKQIVERHHGTINVQSPSHLSTSKYPGTCVKITLPFLKK